MVDIECSDSAYRKITSSDLEKIIKSKIKDEYINEIPKRKKGQEIFNKAREEILTNKKIDELSLTYRNILNMESIIQDNNYISYQFLDESINNPSFLAYFILGDKLKDYREYGFPSIKSLEEAIVSYSIKERAEIKEYDARNRLTWRNNGRKNELYQDMHGDMYISQVNVKNQEEEIETLFGKEIIFESILREPKRGSLYSFQDWSGYLLAALKYAEHIGKSRITEIIEWKEHYKNTHACGNYAEAGSEASFGIRSYIETPILKKDEKINSFPLIISGRNDTEKYPYIEDRKLLYIIESKEGDVNLAKNNNHFKDKKFKKIIEYDEFDLPNILKGNYKLFSRVVANMFYIMDDFNKKH